MRDKILGAIRSVSEPSVSSEQPAEQVQSGKRHVNKRLFVVVAAIAAIVIIVVAVLFVPQGSADVISLGVDYSVGEKLTYDVTVKLTMNGGIGNLTASNEVNADLTLTVEVLSFDGDIYTLNYSVVLPEDNPNVVLTNPNVNSQVVEVQKNEMVTVLALMPAVLQGSVSADDEVNAPLLAGIFDKSEARVGDTWQIPLNTVEGSNNVSFEMLTITFNAIKDVTVEAGSFRVFSFDFSSTYQNQSDVGTLSADLHGQSQLEYGSCKQIQSTLQITMSTQADSLSYTIGVAITSTLTQDSKP